MSIYEGGKPKYIRDAEAVLAASWTARLREEEEGRQLSELAGWYERNEKLLWCALNDFANPIQAQVNREMARERYVLFRPTPTGTDEIIRWMSTPVLKVEKEVRVGRVRLPVVREQLVWARLSYGFEPIPEQSPVTLEAYYNPKKVNWEYLETVLRDYLPSEVFGIEPYRL